MAGVSLLALLDDITALLDDIAVMSKIAVRKTAGVLSDDLALNAEQVSGVSVRRELPVVWAVAKGSALNKLIIIPGALLINAFDSRLIVLLLMIGGAYLCFEGVEKLLHSYQHRKRRGQTPAEVMRMPVLESQLAMTEAELAQMEKKKIRGAVRTDFILSAEIIVIALSVVQSMGFWMQLAVLVVVAFLITAGVYGLVALIVKLDDIGFWMVRRSKEGDMRHRTGMVLVNAAPYLMRFLSVVGTIAMFLVGGGIVLHNTAFLTALEHVVTGWVKNLPAVGGILGALMPTLTGLVIGLIVGTAVVIVVSLVKKCLPARRAV